MIRKYFSDCVYVLFNRDTVDKGDKSWSGPTRMSTESLPSKALSTTSGAVLSPVGDTEPMDRSISQPNIAGGLKLPTAMPPSPTVLASCSSTSSDLSRGGYASADSLGSASSKDDMLSAAVTSEETQPMTTERSARSASPCPESSSSLSVTVEEQSLRSSSLSAWLEPTPDLVLNLPTTSENAAAACAQCSPLTSAEMFASAEHGTIKKSGTPGRSSVSGEDGTSMDEVFPHTPVEITRALECDNFSFDLLPLPPPAVTDVTADNECKLPLENLPALSLGHESPLREASSTVAVHPCSVTVPSTSPSDSCSTGTKEPAVQFHSLQNAESVTGASEVSSSGYYSSAKNDDRSSELESSDLVVDDPLLVSQAETTCELVELESGGKLRLPSCDAPDLSEEVCSAGKNVALSEAELQLGSDSSEAKVAQQPVDLCPVLSSELVTADQVAHPVAEAAAGLTVDAAPSSSPSALDVATASEVPDVLHFPPVSSSPASSAQTDEAAQSTSSVSPSELRPPSTTSPRPTSSPTCAAPSVTVSPQLPEVIKSHHSTAERRSSDSAVATSSQSAVSRLVLATHKHAASVAATSFTEPLPHRPPPSLAAHSAALQLLSQKHDPSGVTVIPVEKPETSTKLEQSPADRPKSKPPPVKKKPTGPLKEKFFSAFGDHHQQ